VQNSVAWVVESRRPYTPQVPSAAPGVSGVSRACSLGKRVSSAAPDKEPGRAALIVQDVGLLVRRNRSTRRAQGSQEPSFVAQKSQGSSFAAAFTGRTRISSSRIRNVRTLSFRVGTSRSLNLCLIGPLKHVQNGLADLDVLYRYAGEVANGDLTRVYPSTSFRCNYLT